MSFKNWQVIAAVVALLVGLEFINDLIAFVPGYAAIREGYPYYFANSYRDLIEGILLVVAAFALLRNSGPAALETLGIGNAPWGGLKAAAVMVVPLYLVYAFAFGIAEMVPMEVLYLAGISPLVEELAYRGFAFGLLRKVTGWGFWPAALFPAAFFAWDHLDLAGDFIDIIMTLAITGLASILFAWLFERWGSLWVPIGLHVMMNFASNLFAVGDGAFAGVLPTVMQLTTAIIAILVTVFRQRIPFLRIAREGR